MARPYAAFLQNAILPPPYPGLHPGLVCRAPLGHPLESSTALSRPVEALLSAVRGQAVYAVRTADWGQAVCAGRGRFKGQAAGSGRIAGGAPRDRACARREARGEGIAFALRARGLGDRLQCSLRLGPAAAWGQACVGRPRGGTGCWEGAKCCRDRLLGIGGLFVEILIAGAGCWLQFGLCWGW